MGRLSGRGPLATDPFASVDNGRFLERQQKINAERGITCRETQPVMRFRHRFESPPVNPDFHPIRL